MWKHPTQNHLFEKFAKYAKLTGAIFIVLGLVGIIYPAFMTVVTVTFVSWLMLFAGFMAAYFTWLSNRNDVMGWLKSFMLIGISLYMLFYPMVGAATIGLLLSIFFFVDGFAGLALALSMRPNKIWIVWMINAIFSFAIGALFILSWPFNSTYLVGLFVGFSLFFDGIALLVGGSFFTKMMK